MAHHQVLPPIFKSKLSRNCKSIKLIDINKEEYTVSVEDFGHHRVKCCNNQWPNFVTTCLEPDTTKLCFRLLQKNVVEVICFDSDGLQASVDEDGIHSTNRCLVEATYETIEEEGLHGCFLEQFDSTSKREPDDTVVIYGSNQNATVNIVFDYEEHSDTQTDVKFEDGEEEEKVYWHAIGLTGATWKNFCMANHIVPGNTIMFTNPKDGTYLVDVFNSEGIGLGVATLKNEQVLSKFYTVGEEDVEIVKHKCRVGRHKHNCNKPNFLKSFPNHALSSKRLTLPKSIVRPYDLHTYERARLNYGTLKFLASLEVNHDSRRVGDESHVVMKRNWMDFLSKTGLVVGDKIRFQLNMEKSVGRVVDFDVC